MWHLIVKQGGIFLVQIHIIMAIKHIAGLVLAISISSINFKVAIQ